MAAYGTPTDFWILSAPPLSLFEDPRIQRGAWTAPARTAGTAAGTLALTEKSNPRDTYAVTVVCTRTGELTTPGYVNRTGLPQLTVNLGAGPSRALEPDAQGRIEVKDLPVPAALSRLTGLAPTGGGFTLALRNPPAGTVQAFGGLSVAPAIGGLALELLASGAALSHVYDRETGRITLYLTGVALAGTVVANYLQNTGLPLVVTGGAAAVPATALTALPFPAFEAGDTWTFTTSPSPDVVAALEVSSDYARSYVRGTFSSKLPATEPLLTWGAALVGAVTDLGRDRLLEKIEGPKDRGKSQAQRWLELVQNGNVEATATEEGPGRSFPLLVTPIDPLSREAGSFPI